MSSESNGPQCVAPMSTKLKNGEFETDEATTDAPLEWDAESIDSAVIDARLHSRASQASPLAPPA